MGNNGHGAPSAPDPVDAAIGAASKPRVQMTVIEGVFNDSGRPFGLSLPEDVTEAEAYAFIELVTAVRQKGAQIEVRRPRIHLPGRLRS